MNTISERVLLCAGFIFLLCGNASAIDCYQCSGIDSDEPFQCNEWLEDVDIQPLPCDAVYGAQYCIKHIGRFEVVGLNCFQCSSAQSIDCSDGMIHMGGIQTQNCSEVFEAQYCIKSTGMDGGIGAKRYCSSLDLGNYCNYVKQPGDILQYRSCVYTCSGNGCNFGNMNSRPTVFAIIFLLIVSVLYNKISFR